MVRHMLFALALAGCAPTLILAEDKKEVKGDDVLAKAKGIVEKKVADMKGANAAIGVIDDKVVRETFPDHVFVAVRFPIWPVARVPEEPLKSQNLFAVGKDDKVTHLPDSKKLEEFFKSTLKTQLNQDKTVRTWLRLRMEYVQDGFYKFKFPEKTEVTGPGSSLTLVTGIVEIVPEGGNKGTFKAVVKFGRADDFSGVPEEDNKVMQGMRPRCQATLLLHPEKLVREIAEQDLLVMGSMAREYIMEQRAKASDDLRREIDRVWQRIVKEGR